jgi:hypothetical protein
MGKPLVNEEPPVAPVNAPGAEDDIDLVEHLRMARARRAYEKFLALKGTIHLNLNIDELRGRNRR